MKSKKLEIEIPEGKTAVWRNGILTLIDEPEKDVRKRIKTFEDACHEIGIDAEAWNRDKISLGLEPDVLAFLKLRIIVKALNEGWEPRFTEDECRYYPWFILYTISWTRKKSLVWCVGRTAARARWAVFRMRTRIAIRRARMRSSAFGLPSKRRNWQHIAVDNSLIFGQTLFFFRKRKVNK
ncbi:hypothetical protein PL498_07985 [Bacteroides xylanisolvens]|uniref:hypothetical protein n=1 Tax=Bacteroides xylanisolvens TaxID=371601 RepID=UPI0023075A3A|nr:hypothetical protein [Bacteroides xylanisolvens]MDB0735922.1 hypothetical protein [Bacteroides xylanisolvens]